MIFISLGLDGRDLIKLQVLSQAMLITNQRVPTCLMVWFLRHAC